MSDHLHQENLAVWASKLQQFQFPYIPELQLLSLPLCRRPDISHAILNIKDTMHGTIAGSWI